TIGFTEYNGSFTFTIGTVPSYTPNVTTGGFRVDGQAVTVRIAFSHTSGTPATYPVWFNETGLPVGTLWSVTLNGTPQSSSGASIAFTETNGSFPFTVSAVSGYTANVTSGTVDVSGSPASRLIGFTAAGGGGGTYPVTFNETGLPGGTTWQVTLSGGTLSSTTASILFTRANGTYPFTVGYVSSYGASPSSGSVSVTGQPVLQNIRFTAGTPVFEASLSASPSVINVSTTTTLTTTTSGGSPPFQYAYSGLPAGCSTSDSASLVCVPSASGSYTVMVDVTGITGAHAFANATLTVRAPPNGSGTSQSGSFLSTYWWLLLIVVVAVIILVLVLRRRRPSPAPPPATMPVAPGP
ncbi:MAG TPA: hypothetical protein VEY07_00910, partial [Thermoplasmata archaeon]|nr:hypothetical protein [Thermoplasmata archaeon]